MCSCEFPCNNLNSNIIHEIYFICLHDVHDEIQESSGKNHLKKTQNIFKAFANFWFNITAAAHVVSSVSLCSQGISELLNMKAKHRFNVERASWVCLSSAVPQLELFVYTNKA